MFSHVLTALDIEHCAVIGTSLGGLLACAMGVAMPTRIQGVVINDIGPVVPHAALEPVRTFVAHPGVYENWDEAIACLKSLFPDLPAEDADDWRTIAEATFREMGDGKLLPDWDPEIGRSIAGPPPPDSELWPLFDSLAGRPLGLLRGAKSQFLTAETFARMRLHRPDMYCAEIEDVGHAPSLVEPPSLDLIKDVLSQCFGTAGSSQAIR